MRPSLVTPEQNDPWGERLPRRLGLFSAAAVVIGSTIGSGIFRTPAVVAERVSDPGLFALAWILGGIVALCGALTYAELASMMPRTGGIYVYVREAFGRLPAFLFGWAELVILRPAAYGAIAITCAEYGWRLAGLDGSRLLLGGLVSRAQVTAAGLVVVVGVVNIRGIHWGAVVQNVSTALKVGALVILIGLGAFLAPSLPPAPTITTEPSLLSGFGLAMVAILWSYDGWADVGFIAGEVRDPQRALPRAFLLGTLAVVTIYLAVNTIYMQVIPVAEMPGSPLIAADVAHRLVGPVGVVLVSGAVMISTFGTLNGSMMTGPRIFYAMAEDRLFFRRLAQIDPRFGTPAAAIMLSVALGVIFVCIKTFAQLADQFIIGIWPFYAAGVAALFVLRRRRPDLPRPYRTWGYPLTPALFLVAATALLANYLVTEPLVFAADLAIIAAGAPVFWWWSRRTEA